MLKHCCLGAVVLLPLTFDARAQDFRDMAREITNAYLDTEAKREEVLQAFPDVEKALDCMAIGAVLTNGIENSEVPAHMSYAAMAIAVFTYYSVESVGFSKEQVTRGLVEAMDRLEDERYYDSAFDQCVNRAKDILASQHVVEPVSVVASAAFEKRCPPETPILLTVRNQTASWVNKVKVEVGIETQGLEYTSILKLEEPLGPFEASEKCVATARTDAVIQPQASQYDEPGDNAWIRIDTDAALDAVDRRREMVRTSKVAARVIGHD